MKRSFAYALEAQNELADIVRYTARQWGEAQARKYAAQLDAAANDLGRIGVRSQFFLHVQGAFGLLASLWVWFSFLGVGGCHGVDAQRLGVGNAGGDCADLAAS